MIRGVTSMRKLQYLLIGIILAAMLLFFYYLVSISMELPTAVIGEAVLAFVCLGVLAGLIYCLRLLGRFTFRKLSARADREIENAIGSWLE
jgi:hypothetical protein